MFSCLQCHVSKRPTCDQATPFLLRLAFARSLRTSRDGGEASLSVFSSHFLMLTRMGFSLGRLDMALRAESEGPKARARFRRPAYPSEAKQKTLPARCRLSSIHGIQLNRPAVA